MLANSNGCRNKRLELCVNKVHLTGVLESDFSYDHTSYGKEYFITNILVDRKSGTIDKIPIVIPKEMITDELKKDKTVNVYGRIRSIYRKECIHKGYVYISVSRLNIVDKCWEHLNEINVSGTILKGPSFRTSFFGRHIADLLIKVDSFSEKTVIVPCIGWESTLKFLEEKNVFDSIRFMGRIQSRKYEKCLEGEKHEVEIIEISICDIIQ